MNSALDWTSEWHNSCVCVHKSSGSTSSLASPPPLHTHSPPFKTCSDKALINMFTFSEHTGLPLSSHPLLLQCLECIQSGMINIATMYPDRKKMHIYSVSSLEPLIVTIYLVWNHSYCYNVNSQLLTPNITIHPASIDIAGIYQPGTINSCNLSSQKTFIFLLIRNYWPC